jgi:hypothetical protein
LFDESLFGLDDGFVYAGGGDDKTMLEVDFRALVGLVRPETLVTLISKRAQAAGFQPQR